jgi:hypothetical protein
MNRLGSRVSPSVSSVFSVANEQLPVVRSRFEIRVHQRSSVVEKQLPVLRRADCRASLAMT